jgi:hypothetical protein
MPYNRTNDNILQVATEIVLQISADVLVTAGLMDYLNNTLDVDQYDPANGFAYILGLLQSQPHLMAKISKFNHMMGHKLRRVGILNQRSPVMGTARVPVPTENQFISGNAAYN